MRRVDIYGSQLKVVEGRVINRDCLVILGQKYNF
jgi:hypothetical protein